MIEAILMSLNRIPLFQYEVVWATKFTIFEARFVIMLRVVATKLKQQKFYGAF